MKSKRYEHDERLLKLNNLSNIRKNETIPARNCHINRAPINKREKIVNKDTKLGEHGRRSLVHCASSHQLRVLNLTLINKNNITTNHDDANLTENNKVSENTSRRFKGFINIFNDERIKEESMKKITKRFSQMNCVPKVL